jgi:hypothetical protein
MLAVVGNGRRLADGIAIATSASVGQRTLTIASEKAPDGAIAVAIVRLRNGGSGFKYTAPAADLAKLGAMNAKLDPRGRWDAVMKEDGLFEVEAYRREITSAVSLCGAALIIVDRDPPEVLLPGPVTDHQNNSSRRRSRQRCRRTRCKRGRTDGS